MDVLRVSYDLVMTWLLELYNSDVKNKEQDNDKIYYPSKMTCKTCKEEKNRSMFISTATHDEDPFPNEDALLPSHVFVMDICKRCELPRLVCISLNIYSLTSVDDKNQRFQVSFIMTCKYNTAPLKCSGGKYFRPWIQFRNAESIQRVRSHGIKLHTDEEVEQAATDPNGPRTIVDIVHYVGIFDCELDLRIIHLIVKHLKLTLLQMLFQIVHLPIS
jgi:hypothetical protein